MVVVDPDTGEELKEPPKPPKIPSGQEIYDMIMSQIEPELVSENLPTLEEKYKDEPEEKKQERLKKYEKAFEEYDKAYELYISDIREKVRRYRHLSFAWAEAQSKNDEDGRLAELEESFS